MKKNRPATMLSIIVAAADEAQAVDIVMKETSTLGVRVRPLERIEAQREVVRIDTSVGNVAVKIKRLDGSIVSVSPEYEDARLRAIEKGLAIHDVFGRIQREAETQIMQGGER